MPTFGSTPDFTFSGAGTYVLPVTAGVDSAIKNGYHGWMLVDTTGTNNASTTIAGHASAQAPRWHSIMRSSADTLRTPAPEPRLEVPERLRMPLALAKLAAILVIAAACLWFGLPQRLGGRADWVLVSGTSMLPRMHTGDLVLVERRSSYHVGEVVAYRIQKGEIGAGYVVIHRIIGGNGRTGWTMKGDNRTAPDLWHPTNQDVSAQGAADPGRLVRPPLPPHAPPPRPVRGFRSVLLDCVRRRRGTGSGRRRR